MYRRARTKNWKVFGEKEIKKVREKEGKRRGKKEDEKRDTNKLIHQTNINRNLRVISIFTEAD